MANLQFFDFPVDMFAPSYGSVLLGAALEKFVAGQ
jgi:hypothetical protein